MGAADRLVSTKNSIKITAVKHAYDFNFWKDLAESNWFDSKKHKSERAWRLKSYHKMRLKKPQLDVQQKRRLRRLYNCGKLKRIGPKTFKAKYPIRPVSEEQQKLNNINSEIVLLIKMLEKKINLLANAIIKLRKDKKRPEIAKVIFGDDIFNKAKRKEERQVKELERQLDELITLPEELRMLKIAINKLVNADDTGITKDELTKKIMNASQICSRFKIILSSAIMDEFSLSLFSKQYFSIENLKSSYLDEKISKCSGLLKKLESFTPSDQG